MPPLYDNIADAFELLPGGSPVTLSNVDATDENPINNEADYMAGNESTWAKVDLSDYIGDIEVTLEIASSTGAGFTPYMEVIVVIDPTFDPANPDWTKVDYASFGASPPYIGDGTTTPPPAVFTLVGGENDPASDTGRIMSFTGIFYFFFTDWEYDGSEGSSSLEYDISPPVCFDAVDIINPESTTAAITSGRVVDTNAEWWDFFFPMDGAVPTLTMTWPGPAGMFKMATSGRMSDTSPSGYVSGSSIDIVVRVDGRIFAGGTSTIGPLPLDGSDFSFQVYQGIAGAAYDDDDYAEALWIPISPGQTVEITIASRARQAGSPFGYIYFECEKVCFFLDEDAPPSTYCTPSLRWPATPLGDVWGSPNGWGGQKFVPDQIWVSEGITPYDEADFPWGVNWTSHDMCALENGNVYVVFHDATGASLGATHYVVIKKYTPGSDDWTQIATLNILPLVDDNYADAPSITTDGEFIYVAWWEQVALGPPASGLWQWHCIKLDPSDDSYVELGTGQNQQGVVDINQNYDWNTLAPFILPSPSGDVYVATVEALDDPDVSAAYKWRMTVWRWDGASWTDLAMPAPSPVISEEWEVIGENGFYDQLAAMVAARSDGPCSDGFTIAVCYFDESIGFSGETNLQTISYTVGTGWHDEIISNPIQIEGSDRINFASGSDPIEGDFPDGSPVYVIDHNLVWSENEGRLLLAFDLRAPSNDEIWDVWRMNDDGDQWELFNEDFPASTATPWRQYRNQAAIGPDGEIYRFTMGETFAYDNNFEPKIAKTSPGFNTGFAIATRNGIGEGATEDGAVRWGVYNWASSNMAICFAGTTCYVMMLIETYQSNGDGTSSDDFGEGFFVFKLPYVPCVAGFRPHIYRRILG
jgi:hypothetical protein